MKIESFPIETSIKDEENIVIEIDNKPSIITLGSLGFFGRFFLFLFSSIFIFPSLCLNDKYAFFKLINTLSWSFILIMLCFIDTKNIPDEPYNTYIYLVLIAVQYISLLINTIWIIISSLL